MLANTQIGGKYDKADSSVFDLKRRFESIDVSVSHPMSDEIISTVDGRGFTFDPDKISFLDVETDYYESIRTSTFHTVNNRFRDDLGYIGGSASLEMAYAMSRRKPILLMHPPRYAATVDPMCIEILTEREDLLHIGDISTMSDAEAVDEVMTVMEKSSIDYGMSEHAQAFVMNQVDILFDQIRNNPL